MEIGEPVVSISPISVIIVILFVLAFIPLIFFLLKRKMSAWSKGGLIAAVIFITILILFGLITAFNNKGMCGFWDSQPSLGNCFAASIILGIIWILPVIIIGWIIGLIIGRIKK